MKHMTLAQAYKQQFGKVSYPFEIYDANGKQTIEINGVKYSADQVRERIAELKPLADS